MSFDRVSGKNSHHISIFLHSNYAKLNRHFPIADAWGCITVYCCIPLAHDFSFVRFSFILRYDHRNALESIFAF